MFETTREIAITDLGTDAGAMMAVLAAQSCSPQYRPVRFTPALPNIWQAPLESPSVIPYGSTDTLESVALMPMLLHGCVGTVEQQLESGRNSRRWEGGRPYRFLLEDSESACSPPCPQLLAAFGLI
eukprot:SAG31_NODE_2771_length_5116_cov_3.598964_3_plen_126_part_00